MNRRGPPADVALMAPLDYVVHSIDFFATSGKEIHKDLMVKKPNENGNIYV